MLKRASASRPSGEWNEDDFDVLADAARLTVGTPAELGSQPVGRGLPHTSPPLSCIGAAFGAATHRVSHSERICVCPISDQLALAVTTHSAGTTTARQRSARC
jgi:hypothetical protein